MTTRKLFKVFWAWQDENEEKWLNEMANKGWGLISYNLIYTFEKIEPTNYVYKLDYTSSKNNDLDEYKTIFNDAGLEYVTRYGDWHYFRTIGSGEETPEIYTDVEYKIEKYKKLLRNLIIAFILLIVISTMFILELFGKTFSNSVSFFLGISTSITTLCIVKVKQKINRLKEY